MNVNFNLRDKNTTAETSVIMVCRWNGYRIKYSTNIRISPKHWQTKKQLIHPRVFGAAKKNDYLKSLADEAISIYSTKLSENKIISTNELKEHLKGINTDNNKTYNFSDILNAYFSEKKITTSKNTFRKSKSTFNKLLQYFSNKKINSSLNSFTKKNILQYCEFLAYECNMTNESIRANTKNIITFLNWSNDNGFAVETDYKKFKFPYKVVQSDQIYLTELELKKLLDLDLTDNPRLDRIRDVFLIECYTSLRYSDLSKIKPEKIQNNQVKIIQEKTKKQVYIPLASESKKLIDKYFSNGLELPVKTNQKMNKYIKELGKIAEINTMTSKTIFSGKNKTEITEPKYEFISTHTGRRTFVTIAYLRGMKEYEIMNITGHTNPIVFKKYAKLDKLNTHESFYKAWDGTNPEVTRIIKNLIKEKIPFEVISRATDTPIEKIKKISTAG